MVINYRGMAGNGTSHSWGIVAVNTMLEMAKLGCEFKIQSTNHSPQQFIGPLQFFALKDNLPLTDIAMGYTLPNHLIRLNGKHRIIFCNNDSSSISPSWVSLLNQRADLIIAASEFASDNLTNNNVNKDKIEIIPHGYDPDVFNPQVEPQGIQDSSLDNMFKFVCVAAPHKRKNIPGLLEAFIEEFKGDEDVCLIIKTSHNSHESNAPFHENLDATVKDLKKRYKFDWPKIVLVTKRLDSLAGLYRYGDALILPSRAECFSMTCLEAAMCKMPVITTDLGGHTDFLNQSNSYLIDYVLEKIPKNAQYHFYNPNAYQAKPLKDDIKRLLRHVKNNQDEAKQKAEKCYLDNKHLTWKHSAEKIIEIINNKGWSV